MRLNWTKSYLSKSSMLMVTDFSAKTEHLEGMG